MWEGLGVLGGADLIVCLCVCVCICVCVCVCARFFPFHTRKGALMLYALYVEPTMGHLEAPMKQCTRGWSSRMATTPRTLGVAH